MVRSRVTGSFRVQDPNTNEIHVINEITEFAVMHGFGGQETELAGKVHLETNHGNGVNDLGGGLFSIPALGVDEAVLIDDHS